jgi:hypothetical protein
MPMYNWLNIYEQHNLTYLSKTRKLCKRAEGVYYRMVDELVDEFGVSEDYLRLQSNKVKIEMYYNDQIHTGDYSNQPFIEILEIDNQELESENSKSDLFDSVISIEKNLGFKLDYKTMTVYEFHKYGAFIEKTEQ